MQKFVGCEAPDDVAKIKSQIFIAIFPFYLVGVGVGSSMVIVYLGSESRRILCGGGHANILCTIPAHF